MATGHGQGSRPPKRMEAPKAVKPRLWVPRTTKRTDKRTSASSRNFLERMPSEVLIKILSHLDASTLFCVSGVNRHLFWLASENALWQNIYMAGFGIGKRMRPKCPDELLLKMATVEGPDWPAGYWKWLYLRTVAACDMNKWKRHLGLISSHTGLPGQTEQVLRDLHISWELTVSDKSGHEGTHEMSSALFSETSVTLCWSRGGCLPNYQYISTLQLHGVRRIALNCPGPNKPVLRSLMAKLDMQTLTKSARVIGEDRMVELRLLQPGIIFGIWKANTSRADMDQCSIAFVMFTLHFHWLVEKSIQGRPVCPFVEPTVKPAFDDIDPEYGLHGYQLHLLLHDTVCEIMSESFSQLFCKRNQVCDGLIQLTAISRTDLSRHKPLSRNITLPWRCEALQGTVQNCCIMNLTLLDEFREPFWCVSSPVSVMLQEKSVSFDYDGEDFLIHYEDSGGQVKMQLVRMEEQNQFFLVSLVVCVTVGKVNEHFSRDY